MVLFCYDVNWSFEFTIVESLEPSDHFFFVLWSRPCDNAQFFKLLSLLLALRRVVEVSPEFFTRHAHLVGVGKDTTLLGNVLSGVQVITSDHSHNDSGPLARFNSFRNLNKFNWVKTS